MQKRQIHFLEPVQRDIRFRKDRAADIAALVLFFIVILIACSVLAYLNIGPID
jgi:hypothetical protein